MNFRKTDGTANRKRFSHCVNMSQDRQTSQIVIYRFIFSLTCTNVQKLNIFVMIDVQNPSGTSSKNHLYLSPSIESDFYTSMSKVRSQPRNYIHTHTIFIFEALNNWFLLSSVFFFFKIQKENNSWSFVIYSYFGPFFYKYFNRNSSILSVMMTKNTVASFHGFHWS